MVAADPSRVAVLHTLGPTGTNCEAAAHAWFRRQGGVGRVELHSTLEQAVERMPEDDTHALLSCVVYPELHTLVFPISVDLHLQIVLFSRPLTCCLRGTRM